MAVWAKIPNQDRVEAVQEGDSIILNFMQDGKCTTRITLVDQVREGQHPLIDKVIVPHDYGGEDFPVGLEIDISRAASAEDFESLFNERMPEYQEMVSERSRELTEEYGIMQLEGNDGHEYGQKVRNATYYWQDLQETDGVREQVQVTFRPERSKEEEKEPLMPLTIANKEAAVIFRERPESWVEKLDRKPQESRGPER